MLVASINTYTYLNLPCSSLVITPCACTRGKVIGLSVCCRRCFQHKNCPIWTSSTLASSNGNLTIKYGKKVGQESNGSGYESYMQSLLLCLQCLSATLTADLMLQPMRKGTIQQANQHAGVVLYRALAKVHTEGSRFESQSSQLDHLSRCCLLWAWSQNARERVQHYLHKTTITSFSQA